MPRRINPAARSPLLRKGGAHQKSRSGERRKRKQATNNEAREWSTKGTGRRSDVTLRVNPPIDLFVARWVVLDLHNPGGGMASAPTVASQGAF
jgi:hypothetical protein